MKTFLVAKGFGKDIVRLVLNGYVDAEVVRPVKLGEVKNIDLKPLRSKKLMAVPQDVLPELVGECPRSAKTDAFLEEAWQKVFTWLKK